MQDFKKLRVWEKSHQLTLDVYRLTVNFPHSEQYGLTNQVRRSVTSIAANIAEGCGRQSNKEMNQYLTVALGSACETEYHFLLAHDLGYITQADYDRLNNEITAIKQMLTSLIKTIREKQPTHKNNYKTDNS
ncbi:MAG: four helix bundle protein [Anaerolineales bacterium]